MSKFKRHPQDNEVIYCNSRYLCIQWKESILRRQCLIGGEADVYNYPCDCYNILHEEMPGWIDRFRWGYDVEESYDERLD